MSINLFTAPGYVCPFCGADCSPIASPCAHMFLIDGENGWRFSALARTLYVAAEAKRCGLFRDLLYHDDNCREPLVFRQADYPDSLEIFAFTDDADRTKAVFEVAIHISHG